MVAAAGRLRPGPDRRLGLPQRGRHDDALGRVLVLAGARTVRAAGGARYRLEAMSHGELGFLIFMALLGLLLMPWAEKGGETTGLIRSAIGDVAAVREDYDAGKGSHAFRLEIAGRDNRSYGDISGTYPVIGPFGEGGFMVETPAGPRSVCRAGACD